MSLQEELNRIDWDRLMREWKSFVAEDSFRELDPKPFVQALIRPVPWFVEKFLSARNNIERDITIRDLYAYLLDKRYFERLNLLHFAFHIFDEDSPLPEDVIDRTPLPHEDGIPHYRHALY